jgi:hypothetical protein
VGLTFGVPESWAGITSPPWPALSDTVGHLEQLWHPVRVIVVALIVFIVFHAVRYPPGHTGEFTAGEGRPERARTPCGRFARCGTGTGSAVSVFVYFPLAVGVVAGGSVIAAIAGSDMFVLGYVIYGLIAIFLVIIRTRWRSGSPPRCRFSRCTARSPTSSAGGARPPGSSWRAWSC